MLKSNLGCGSVQPEGWINVDYSLGARLSEIPLYNFINKRIKLFDIGPDGRPRVWEDKIYTHNLNKRFPWDNNSVDIIYCSHTLEHFSKQEGLVFLQECHRVMKKGGIIRIVVPDLKSFVEEYRKGNMRSDEFVEKLGVLYEKKKSHFKNLLMTITQFPHRCMYDTETLSNILTAIGFVVESKQPFKGDILDIDVIELAERTENAVIVEGKKS
jgi:predicted SAM-dependent methyltransferase